MRQYKDVLKKVVRSSTYVNKEKYLYVENEPELDS